jgi:hypothetical protein
MVRDMNQRRTMVRVDDAQRRSNVNSARRLIYEGNVHVNGARVEGLLWEKSLVPSVVCAKLSTRPLSYLSNLECLFA